MPPALSEPRVDRSTARKNSAAPPTREPDPPDGQAGRVRKLKAKLRKQVLGDLVTDDAAHMLLDVGWLHPSPFQPRQDFAEAELEELAATIRTSGLLQPILVRAVENGAYEIVAGERRWRAAQRAGLDQVPCLVRPLNDAQACEATVVENFARSDLNPLEEARGFESLLKLRGDDGQPLYTQEKLAERLGVSQPQIANRLRLLKLPEPWRGWLAAGKVTATQARGLLGVEAFSEIITGFAKHFARNDLKVAPLGTGEFAERLSDWIRGNSRSIEGTQSISYGNWQYAHVPKYKPTAEELVQLRVVEIPDRHTGKTIERRALNESLWEKLNNKHLAAKKKELEARKSPNVKAKAAATKPAKLTPAKLTPAEEKAKRAEAAKRFAKQLENFRTNWLQWLVAQKLVALGKLKPAAAAMTLLRVAAALHGYRGSSLANHFDGRAREASPGLGVGDDAALPRLAAWCAEFFWQDDAPVEGYHTPQHGAVGPIATLLGVNAAEAWQREQCGPHLSERYWALHPLDRLEQLAGQLKVYLQPNRPKSVHVATLVRSKGLKLPAELANLVSTKKGRK